MNLFVVFKSIIYCKAYMETSYTERFLDSFNEWQVIFNKYSFYLRILNRFNLDDEIKALRAEEYINNVGDEIRGFFSLSQFALFVDSFDLLQWIRVERKHINPFLEYLE